MLIHRELVDAYSRTSAALIRLAGRTRLSLQRKLYGKVDLRARKPGSLLELHLALIRALELYATIEEQRKVLAEDFTPGQRILCYLYTFKGYTDNGGYGYFLVAHLPEEHSQTLEMPAGSKLPRS